MEKMISLHGYVWDYFLLSIHKKCSVMNDAVDIPPTKLKVMVYIKLRVLMLDV